MTNKVYWTHQSRADLRALQTHIARDAPATATAFVRKLRQAVGRLERFPYSGQVVPEIGREDIRELLRGNYRLIYRAYDGRVDILTVFHGAQILDEKDF